MISANLSKSERRAIYKRDGYRCALCDSPQGLQIHHIVFRSHGGSNDPANLITLCWRCHAEAHGTAIPERHTYQRTSWEDRQSLAEEYESRPAQSTSVTTTPTWASSLTLSTVGGFNAPL